MKATKDTQTYLTLCLDELKHKHTPEALRLHRHNVSYTTDQYTSFVWSLYYRIPKADRDAIRNNQGDPLADDHIETALKKALSTYK